MTIRKIAAPGVMLACLSFFISQVQAAPTLSTIEARAARQAKIRRVEREFRRIGILGAHTPLITPRILAPRSEKTSASNLSARAASDELNFSAKAFDASQNQGLFNVTNFPDFLPRIYPILKQVYGAPSPAQLGKTVQIGALKPDVPGQDVEGYAPSADGSTGGFITLDPFLESDFLDTRGGCDATCARSAAKTANQYNVIRLMLNAFHGRQIFAFDLGSSGPAPRTPRGVDAWELGFSSAAGMVAFYEYLNRPANFNPSDYDIYLLPIYDVLNRPELGNAFFFYDDAAQNSPQSLPFYRIGMAQATWLKVWVENPQFFSDFNAAYYRQAGSNAALSGNVPALQNIAATVAPAVEGLTFTDWYRRQFVLDTTVTTGEKLWPAIAPFPRTTAGDTRAFFTGTVQHYQTLSNGTEQALAGQGTVQALDERGLDISGRSNELARDNTLVFNTDGVAEIGRQNVLNSSQTPIIGFSQTGTPDQGRITLRITTGSVQTTAIFPYGTVGTQSAPGSYYGAVVGANNGSIGLSVSGGAGTAERSLGTAVLARGAFGLSGSYPNGPRVVTTFAIAPSDGGAALSVKRNAAWTLSGGQAQPLVVVLETAPGDARTNLATGVQGENTLRMVSFPLFPLLGDEADILGVTPRSKLRLARWKANLQTPVYRAGTGGNSGFYEFGQSSDKYERYPFISAPIAPGRGYWIKLGGTFVRSLRGAAPPNDRPFDVDLAGGWNQIGVPFNNGFALQNLGVRVQNGDAIGYAQAVARGLIAPGVWRWKPEGGYARVDTAPVAERVLQPFEGYYVFATPARGLKLAFGPNGASVVSASIKAASHNMVAAAASTDWQMSLSVVSGATRDESNQFGTTRFVDGRPLRRAAAKPPAPYSILTLAFASSGDKATDAIGAGSESGWADSFMAPFDKAASWPFEVSGAKAGAPVSVTWSDAGALPTGFDFVLHDLQSGARAPLHPGSKRSYTFVSDGTTRAFRIEAARRTTLIRDWTAQSAGGSRGANLTLLLNAPARLRVEVRDEAEQTIRVLAEDFEARAGTLRWNWNGRDDKNLVVSGGHYRAWLRAISASGAMEEREVMLP